MAEMLPGMTESDRGFHQAQKIVTRDGNEVSVTESSLATEAAVWLRVSKDSDTRAVSMSLDEARTLREQLDWFLENHYQLTPAPTAPAVARMDGTELAEKMATAIAAMVYADGRDAPTPAWVTAMPPAIRDQWSTAVFYAGAAMAASL